MNFNVNLPKESQIVDVLLKCGYGVNTFENCIDGFKRLNEVEFPRLHVRVEKQGRDKSWKGSSYDLHIDLEKPKHSHFWGKCYISSNDEIKNEKKLLKQVQNDLLQDLQSKGILLKEESNPIALPSKKEIYVKIKQLKVSFRTIKIIKCPKINKRSQIRRKKIIEYISLNLGMIKKDMHIIPPFNGTLKNLIENNDHLFLAADKYKSYLIYIRQCRGWTGKKRNRARYKLKYYNVIIDPFLENRNIHYVAVLYDYMNGELFVERMYGFN
jgi:hypothetical protein